MGNKSSPFVLRALCVLGPEEILKLAHCLSREEIGLKKASGDDVAFWKDDTARPKKKDPAPPQEAKVLQFGRPSPKVDEKEESAPEESESGDVQILSSELILLQREISRESVTENQKQSAKSGYQKATEMYVVKSPAVDGKEKIRFASTNGVLINKKQA